jgi:hypothetical protein
VAGAGWPPRRPPTTGEQAKVFVEHGYVVTVGDRRLAAPVAAAERVLVWRGWPTLGSVSAWALARDRCERRRGEVHSQ